MNISLLVVKYQTIRNQYNFLTKACFLINIRDLKITCTKMLKSSLKFHNNEEEYHLGKYSYDKERSRIKFQV